ncbi:uncharacterized protein LOC124894443 isoform X2 [Capsicum annuum]|uniref:uncharacterized protein LOC124894443 isoform X2 n=1 Tax=Capsicum annuum TaxID=4072 RepID=UPI001FB199A6|nr:uncharacterized protein LOC124894443 isoform X2 [Capsicum annuum]
MLFSFGVQPDLKIQTNQDIMKQEGEYDKEEALEEISKELEQFEDKPNPNLNETEPINLENHHQVESKGKFSQNWQGPFIVKKVLPNGALYLTDIEGKMAEMAINVDAVKRYYV